jgi:hypothetical protein
MAGAKTERQFSLRFRPGAGKSDNSKGFQNFAAPGPVRRAREALGFVAALLRLTSDVPKLLLRAKQAKQQRFATVSTSWNKAQGERAKRNAD